MSYSTDYYKILNLSYDASIDEIKASYRRLCKLYHPDINKNSDSSKFLKIKEAYETLSDPIKKFTYDSNFRSYRTKVDNRRKRFSEVKISINTSIFGGDIDAIFSDKVKCSHCKCVGAPCIQCGGSGKISVMGDKDYICNRCGGYGYENPHNCNHCHGSGKEIIDTYIKFTIPPLVKEGSKFRIVKNNIEYIIKVKFKKTSNDKFDRKGNDLFVTIPIDPISALIGGEVIVPCIDKSIELSFPENIKGKAVYRLDHKGVPGTNGGMFVILVIDYNLVNIDQINKIKKLFKK